MKFDLKKLEFDCEKLPTMQDVRAKARKLKSTAVFHYPFGELKCFVVSTAKFAVESNKIPNLKDYGLCKYKCGKVWYHAIYYLTSQSSRGQILSERIKNGDIRVGRRKKTQKEE